MNKKSQVGIVIIIGVITLIVGFLIGKYMFTTTKTVYVNQTTDVVKENSCWVDKIQAEELVNNYATCSRELVKCEYEVNISPKISYLGGGSGGGSGVSSSPASAPEVIVKEISPVDYNQDGIVDSQDFGIFKQKVESLKSVYGTNNTEWDLNSDGIVDSQDFTILKAEGQELINQFGDVV